MTDLTWTNDTRKLSDLVPWEHNPKRMTQKQADGLRASIEHFGFAVPFLIDEAGNIYDGHQRQTLMGAIKEYGPNATVDVRVSSRPLTDDERRELVVRLKQNQASWDFDMLPNLYEKDELLEWGFSPFELGITEGDNPKDEWGGMPEFSQEDKTSFQSIHVHFKGPEEVAEFGRLIGQSLTDKTRSVWFSEREKMLDHRERYSDEP